MRKIAGVCGVAGLLLSLAAMAVAADPPAKKDKKADDAKSRASQLAQDIFNNVDKHKHGFINKVEFKKADSQLSSDLKQMAVDGVIGKGRPSSEAKSIISAFTEGFASADTDHDKKVTLSEFTDYVSRATDAVDQRLRIQALAAAAAANRGGGYGGHGGRR